MEGVDCVTKVNPITKANILSKLYFWFLIKYIRKCSSSTLNVNDLFKLPTQDTSDYLRNRLELKWDEELRKIRNKSLLRTILTTFWWYYLKPGIWLFVQIIIFRTLHPVLLFHLLNLFSDKNGMNNMTHIYLSIIIFIVIITVSSLLYHNVNYYHRIVGMQIRVAVSSLIYKKILKMDVRVLNDNGIGQIINLLSSDVGTFDVIVHSLNYIWVIPIHAVLIAYLLWQHIHVSAFVGIFGMILLSLPTSCFLSKLQSSFRRKVVTQTDARIKLMSNIINGIYTIKMYAWEKPFSEIVRAMRSNEVKIFRKLLYNYSVMRINKIITMRLCIFITLTCYVLLGNSLQPHSVFTIALYFNTLQLSVVVLFPQIALNIPNSLIAIKRIQDFLLLNEKPAVSYVVNMKSEFAVELTNVNARWNYNELVLKNVNLKLPRGCLCAIVGQVGSGKTTLLELLLNELRPISGQIQVNGKVSYVAQKAWLFSSTVKRNILFCENYNQNRFDNVIRMCCLDEDLQQFPQRDNSLVGERGIVLSGGQKARINLARAVYRNADIYLFDDPLSALDTSVSSEIFTNCMKNYLKNKTRILVTHQIQFLKDVDYIVVLKKGKIVAQGTYEQLSQTKELLFANISKDKDLECEKTVATASKELNQQKILKKSSKSIEKLTKIVKNPLFEYIKSTKRVVGFYFVLILFFITQFFYSASDYWIRIWTEEESIRQHSNKSFYQINQTIKSPLYDMILMENEEKTILKSNIAIFVYCILIFFAIFLTFVRNICYFSITKKASKNIHEQMFESVTNAPIKFFETNTSGEILNRFSKDLICVDEHFPDYFAEHLQMTLNCFGFLMCIMISDGSAFVYVVVLLLILIFLRKSYFLTGKELKRLESEIKSKVFSHANFTIDGITTIRAFKAERILQRQFDEYQDVHSSAYLLSLCSHGFYGIVVDILLIMLLILVLVIVIFSYKNDNYNAPWAGLFITQTLSLQLFLQYCLRLSSEVINNLTGIERVLEYSRLDGEEVCKTSKQVENWPKNGLIQFINVCMKYSPDASYSLQNINITILPGEKIGIVGRTGAGKTSLIKSLFRLAPIEGTILIDKIDIKTISLMQLRKSISIIPQDPVLFHNSIRYNLDPFNEYSDAVLWKAINEVELGDKIISLNQNLSEGGNNFSFGERQLFCLARTIVKDSSILILDEATANIDQKTDNLIQKTIRKKFQNCTVLKIAHRLNTIIDSDRVLVMENGKIVEFDHPHLLLQNPNGHFTQMVMKMENSSKMHLRNVALECFRKKYM